MRVRMHTHTRTRTSPLEVKTIIKETGTVFINIYLKMLSRKVRIIFFPSIGRLLHTVFFVVYNFFFQARNSCHENMFFNEKEKGFSRPMAVIKTENCFYVLVKKNQFRS